MIIHDVYVEHGTVRPGDESTVVHGVTIRVGATDRERWRWELEDRRAHAAYKPPSARVNARAVLPPDSATCALNSASFEQNRAPKA